MEADTTSAKLEQIALEWKERGNGYYNKRQFEEASEAYRSGLEALKTSRENNDSLREMELALRSNLAMVFLKMNEFQESFEQCSLALNVDPEHPKSKCLKEEK